MLRVIPEACQFTPDRTTGRVVVESDTRPFSSAIEELQTSDAIKTAQAFAAQQGCTPASVNGTRLHPYAVNSEGVPLENVRGANDTPLPPGHPLMQPHRYRIDVQLTRPIM